MHSGRTPFRPKNRDVLLKITSGRRLLAARAKPAHTQRKRIDRSEFSKTAVRKRPNLLPCQRAADLHYECHTGERHDRAAIIDPRQRGRLLFSRYTPKAWADARSAHAPSAPSHLVKYR